MKIFISHSGEDRAVVQLISEKLTASGHLIIHDSFHLRAGDNIIEKIDEGFKDADLILVVLSRHSVRSKWMKYEYSALAFSDITTRKRRIIPVLVDRVPVPSYLSNLLQIDLSKDLELGISRLEMLLKKVSTKGLKAKKLPQQKGLSLQTNRLASLKAELKNGRLTLICGAGVSIGAGIPSWDALLIKLLESMVNKLSAEKSIDLSSKAVSEFKEKYGSSALIIGKYLKVNLGNDFLKDVRDALYETNPTSCQMIDSVVEMSRPQRDGKPLDSIITFNFDSLIEENLKKHNIKHKAIFTESVKHRSNELPIYHVHGYLPRKGTIPKDNEIVFSEDAYHSQFIEPFSWSNLIQLNKLSQNTCLFVGLSLTDPNLRRLLDVANRKNPDTDLAHYIIKKTPSFGTAGDGINELARFLEEQDANELGLNVLWVEEFSEIPLVVKELTNED